MAVLVAPDQGSRRKERPAFVSQYISCRKTRLKREGLARFASPSSFRTIRVGDSVFWSQPSRTVMPLLGLRTIIYKVPDLARAKAWYGETFGISPYFDEPFYVGFNVGGYELGLDPDTKKQGAGAG